VNIDHIKKLLLEVKDILNIEEEIQLKRNSTRFQAELSWNEQSRNWIVYYEQSLKKFVLSHELGHIYYAKQWINFNDFAIPPPFNIRAERDFFLLVNNLLDCFVNHSLSKFSKLYTFYKEELFSYYLDNLDDFCLHIEKHSDKTKVLSWFFLFYIDFKYIIKEKDANSRREDIKRLLDKLKERILQILNNDNTTLDLIIERLDRFNDVKETRDPRLVIHYFVNLLLASNIWDKEQIMTQIKIFFPNCVNLIKKK